MEQIERDLLNGGCTVMCANCPYEIKLGDSYVIRGRYMYCCEECADDETF